MADFQSALKVVLDHEKGFANFSNDNGGATNFGISTRTLSAYLKKPVSEDQIKALTEVEAGNIYKTLFWNPMKLGLIENQALSTTIFDLSVLSGGSFVVRSLQEILQLFQDGILGDHTISAINQYVDASWLAMEVIKDMQIHFVNIVVHDPTQLVFLSGWIHRSQDLLSLIYPAEQNAS